MLEEELRNKVSEWREEVVAVLSDLISFPTINPPGESYKECVDYLAAKLKSWGIDHRLVTVPNGKNPRFSLLGEHGQGNRKLHFHGHFDVVPAQSSSQFKPEVRGDLLYGRGSSDMKGGLAAMLFALRAVKECGKKLSGCLSFSLVPDEETGGRLGTQYLLESGLVPELSQGMLMPEPTSGVIWNANRGALTCRITVSGKYAHVGLEHEGVNAFEAMVEIARSMLKLKEVVKKRKTSMAVRNASARSSVMLIGGEAGSGVSFNAVPEKAFFTIDRRINPEETLEAAKKELLEVLEKYKKKGIKVEAEVLQEGEPSAADTRSPLAEALKDAVLNVTGKAPVFELCPGLCEIRFFNNRGVPAYAFGPGLLQVSHGPVEYIKISEVLNCVYIYALTAVKLLT